MIQHLTEIVEEARKKGKKRLAVAYGQDSHTLAAVYKAYKEGLVEPTLYGDKAVIEEVCKENDLDINAFNIVHEPNDTKCVQLAVASVVAGNADVLMKGLVSTDKYMRGILNKEAGLFPPKGVLSHVSIVEMPFRFYRNLRKSNTFFITFDKTDAFFVDNFSDNQNNSMCKLLKNK